MAKILVIDDSAFQRRTLRKILEAEEHEIQEAANGRIGLEVYDAFAPDCILLDILMPEVNGLSFLQQLRSTDTTTPVIVLTADIQETTCQECLKLGAEEVMHKPLLPAEGGKLRAIVNTVLRQSREGAK